MNDQPSCRSEFSSQSAPSAITADPNRPAGYPASRAERRPWPGTPARAPADPNLSNAMPHNVRPACTLCRPSLADRHPATTNARPRPIPRACRRREPPSRNAIQRETGERPAPTDPAHRTPPRRRPGPSPSRANRGREPAERIAIQRGTVARPTARQGSPSRQPTEAAGARRPSTHTHPTPKCAGQPPRHHRSQMTPVTGPSISPTHLPTRPRAP
jgi:hypothetical protein